MVKFCGIIFILIVSFYTIVFNSNDIFQTRDNFEIFFVFGSPKLVIK